ncbi:hypothetical protein [Bacillus sp. CX-1]|uniref:hypothetical protein n=1 Tax=Bacillus sp. CX-1 TaxID=2045018 RepID=UPI000BF30EC7|nr:hypothetical protein [Bacillus sp. CX-1]
MSITKMETREVFDRSKIGEGDVIEFAELRFYMLRFRELPNKTVGVVKFVYDESIDVYARSQADNWEKDHVTEVSIPVERADSIKILYRHPANEN